MENTVQARNKNTAYYIHCIIFVLLTIGIGFLPPFGQITTMGMKVLGVFVGVIYGWIFIGFIWPSFFGMIVLGLTGYSNITGVFSAAFGDSIVLQLIAMFLFTAILEQCGLTTWIAQWCVSRKVCVGRPWILTAFFFLACFLVGGCINLYGGVMVLWSIFYAVAKTAGFKKGDTYVTYMVSGIVFISTISIISMPFLPLAIIYNGLLKDAATGFSAPIIAQTITGLAIVFFSILGYLFVGKFILKADVTPFTKNADMLAQYRNIKMDKEQKICIALLAVFVFIILTPKLVSIAPLKAVLNNIGIIGAALFAVIVQCLRRDSEGKPIYNFKKLASSGLNWDLIILFAATMPISAAMESSDTGIIATLVSMLMPIFQSLSPVAFMLVCMAIFWAATQLAHNLILVIVFMPTLASIGVSMGINPYLFCLLFCMTTNCAFMTPGASAQAAMIFGNTDWISTKDAYKYCTIFAVVALLAITCIGLPLGLLLF